MSLNEGRKAKNKNDQRYIAGDRSRKLPTITFIEDKFMDHLTAGDSVIIALKDNFEAHWATNKINLKTKPANIFSSEIVFIDSKHAQLNVINTLGMGNKVDIDGLYIEVNRDYRNIHIPNDDSTVINIYGGANIIAGGYRPQIFGYDFNRGRLDSTVHPFEISFTREDVRITTRFYENFLNPSLFGTLHEAGHGIYEQNIDPNFTRTAFTTDFLSFYAVGGVSFGTHESQSRLYENHIGRSKKFWENHFDELVKCFPEALKNINCEDFFKAVNVIEPSLIRVESDESTYDFHIMLRVEIESMLVDQSLKVKDLPEAWNEQIKKYLDLKVPNDSLGVLQDIHWSGGQFGTFCNYTIGNVMAAQLMSHMKETDQSIQESINEANYSPIMEWLKKNIHQHGRRYSRNELLVNSTGRVLDPKPYISYLKKKASEVYGVNLND